MVFTISYFATGSESVRQRMVVEFGASAGRTSAPIDESSRRWVAMSHTWGMFSRMISSSVRIAAAMQGSAEFLAPETRIVPVSGLPPRMTNLSMNAEEPLDF